MRSLDTPTRLSFDLGLANVCVRVLAYMHVATYVRMHLQCTQAHACMHVRDVLAPTHKHNAPAPWGESDGRSA